MTLLAAATVTPGLDQLPDGAEPMTRFFASIRDQMAEGTVVRWTGTLPDDLDTTQLHHLPPPAADARGGGPGPRVAAWTRTFRPALFYYRLGPGFVIVKDVRVPSDAARLTMDHPDLIKAFLRYLTPGILTDCAGPDEWAAGVLLDADLLLRIGDYVTTAPHRMRRWPIPARAA